ncbi:MAG: hypothetical protein ACREQ2_19475 [Candidatus Binatia bacterium]
MTSRWSGEDQMMAAADTPHGEARERSMDIVRSAHGPFRAGKEEILGENAERFHL